MRYRHARHRKRCARRAVAGHHGDLELGVHAVHAAAVDDGDEAPVLLDHGGALAVDLELAEDHAARHQRQLDTLAVQHLDVERGAPSECIARELTGVARAAHGVRAPPGGMPGDEQRRHGRYLRLVDDHAVAFLARDLRRRHQREIHAAADVAERERGRRRTRHRQAQGVALERGGRVDAVAERQCDLAGPVGAVGESLARLHELDGLAVDEGPIQRCARRQQRHQGPARLEHGHAQLEADARGEASGALLDAHLHVADSERVAGGGGARLVDEPGVRVERHAHLAGDGRRRRGLGRERDRGKQEKQGSHVDNLR